MDLKCYFIPWNRNSLLQADVKATVTLRRGSSASISLLMIVITFEIIYLMSVSLDWSFVMVMTVYLILKHIKGEYKTTWGLAIWIHDSNKYSDAHSY